MESPITARRYRSTVRQRVGAKRPGGLGGLRRGLANLAILPARGLLWISGEVARGYPPVGGEARRPR